VRHLERNPHHDLPVVRHRRLQTTHPTRERVEAKNGNRQTMEDGGVSNVHRIPGMLGSPKDPTHTSTNDVSRTGENDRLQSFAKALEATAPRPRRVGRTPIMRPCFEHWLDVVCGRTGCKAHPLPLRRGVEIPMHGTNIAFPSIPNGLRSPWVPAVHPSVDPLSSMTWHGVLAGFPRAQPLFVRSPFGSTDDSRSMRSMDRLVPPPPCLGCPYPEGGVGRWVSRHPRAFPFEHTGGSGVQGMPVGRPSAKRGPTPGSSGPRWGHVSTDTRPFETIEGVGPHPDGGDRTWTEEVEKTCSVETLRWILFLDGRCTLSKRKARGLCRSAISEIRYSTRRGRTLLESVLDAHF